MQTKSCQQILRQFEREGSNFMERIVTVDETWISFYTPEAKQQSTMWMTPGSPSPKSLNRTSLPRNRCLSSSLILEVWSFRMQFPRYSHADSQCSLLHAARLNELLIFLSFITQTSNVMQKLFKAFYPSFQVLRRPFLKSVRKKRAKNLRQMIFNQDNATAHRAATTQKALKQLGHIGQRQHRMHSNSWSLRF